MKTPKAAKWMSDEAVRAKTGKTWAEWFRILDKAGAKKWPHGEIAEYLHEKVGPWWSQMVTVGYERERGLREVHETAQGYTASSSRTIGVPLARLYKAWADGKMRRRWLGSGKMEISTATANKSLHAAWYGGKSRISVMFLRKGPRKSQVTVDHRKLRNAKESAKIKSYWFKALNRLEKTVSG